MRADQRRTKNYGRVMVGKASGSSSWSERKDRVTLDGDLLSSLSRIVMSVKPQCCQSKKCQN